jgi:hypothetical protein
MHELTFREPDLARKPHLEHRQREPTEGFDGHNLAIDRIFAGLGHCIPPPELRYAPKDTVLSDTRLKASASDMHRKSRAKPQLRRKSREISGLSADVANNSVGGLLCWSGVRNT